MPRTKISEFSSTPASNTDIDSIFIGEGMAPSNVNDAIRELMAQLKDFQVGSAGDPVTVGGVLTVQAGAVGTPAITTAGDTNTGMFFPAADTIAFAEGGAEVARFDSSGNLGLGVTPSAWASGQPAMQIGAGTAINNRSAVLSQFSSNQRWDGSSHRYLTTGTATLYTQNDGAHSWATAPSGTAGNAITFTQAMTLDASGNLLVGTTSATYSASGRGLVEINGSSTSLLALKTGGNAAGYVYHDGTEMSVVNTKAGSLQLTTNGAERARIDSSGRLLVGTTDAAPRNFTSGSGFRIGDGNFEAAFASGNNILNITSASGTIIEFRKQGPNAVGSITTNGTITVYNTTSDYRLKTIVGAVTGQGARIDALEPIEYTWKSNNSRTRGFLAHKFQEVYADSVTGTKDAVDAEGNPVYQAMQAGTAEVIADLVAEIQSLRKRLADAGIA